MAQFIYAHNGWPAFQWDHEAVSGRLGDVRHEQGRLLGQLAALGFPLRQEAVLETLTLDVVKTSEIEGEQLDSGQVRSSIARRLGMDVGGLPLPDRNVDGVVEMMLDATQRFDAALTRERLFGWHAALFPSGRSGLVAIRTGNWRDDAGGPMQVVSGRVGRERVHFEAPPAAKVDAEIGRFLDWFRNESQMDGVLRAAVSHLWFVTIHPFDDGNGRMARAIADLCLARSERSAQRFYSMSGQIRQERTAYYDILESTQKGGLDITPWMEWFLDCLGRAIDGAQEVLAGVRRKARVWEAAGAYPLNARQRLVLGRLLEGFTGNLTTSKWTSMAKCSQDTALRDISQLVEWELLLRNSAGGRSTHYSLHPRVSAGENGG